MRVGSNIEGTARYSGGTGRSHKLIQAGLGTGRSHVYVSQINVIFRRVSRYTQTMNMSGTRQCGIMCPVERSSMGIIRSYMGRRPLTASSTLTSADAVDAGKVDPRPPVVSAAVPSHTAASRGVLSVASLTSDRTLGSY